MHTPPPTWISPPLMHIYSHHAHTNKNSSDVDSCVLIVGVVIPHAQIVATIPACRRVLNLMEVTIAQEALQMRI